MKRRRVGLCFLLLLIGLSLFGLQLGVSVVPDKEGLRIARVYEGAPAYGVLRKGDILLSLSVVDPQSAEMALPYINYPLFCDFEETGEQERLLTETQLSRALGAAYPDDILEIRFLRAGSARKVFLRGKCAIPERPFLIMQTRTHTAPITRMALLASQELLVTVSLDKTLMLWDGESGGQRRAFRLPEGEGEENRPFSVAISPLNGDIVCGSWKASWETANVLTVFDVESGEIRTVIRHLPNVAYHLAFSPDGRYLAASLGWGGGLYLFDARNGYALADVYQTDASGSMWCDFSPDGSKLAATSDLGSITLFAVNGGKLSVSAQRNEAGRKPYTVAFSPDGRRLAASFLNDSQAPIEVYSAVDLTLNYRPMTKGISNRLTTLCWSQDGGFLYAGGAPEGQQNWLYCWERGGRGAYSTIPIPADEITQLIPYKDAVIWSAYDASWGIATRNGLSLCRKPATLFGIREPDPLQLDENGERLRFSIPGYSSAFVFDCSQRILYRETPGFLPFSLLPPITTGMGIEDWKESETPTINGELLPLQEGERSRALSVHPSLDRFLIGTEWYLRQYGHDARLLWSVLAPGVVLSVRYVKNGAQCAAAFSDGTVRFYRSEDGEELCALRIDPETLEWIMWTPAGYYACDGVADRNIGWVVNQGANRAPAFFPIDRYYETFFRPDIVTACLQKNRTDGEVLYESRRFPDRIGFFASPPELRAVSIEAGRRNEAAGMGMALSYERSEPRATEEVFLYIDGRRRAVSSPVTEGDRRRIEFMVYPGERSMLLMIRREDGVYSNRWEALIPNPLPKEAPSNMHIVCLAVSDYKTARPLKYTVNDAAAFAERFGIPQPESYQNTVVHTLTNEDFTVQNLEALLAKLIQEIKETDALLFFYSGHGTLDMQAPDVPFSLVGPQGEKIPFIALDRFFQTVKAKGVALFIDACQSGALPDAYTKAFLLHRKAGINVFSSSYSEEASHESGALEHGVFTYALLESAVSTGNPVTLRSLAENLRQTAPEIYAKYGRSNGYPKILCTGSDFILLSGGL